MSARITDMDEGIPLADLSPATNVAPPTEEIQRRYQTEAYVDNNINYQYRAPGITVENTVWDVYNNEARKVDYEMVKDWRDSLNSLLLFAAIFAAVLTAFIIESKKMLEQDQTELLVGITLWSMNNMGNKSAFPYTLPAFEPTPTAVAVNCLLFASLGTSLFAALASVVALQWVGDYDAATTRGGSSAEDRAKRRQLRFGGVIDWKMGEMIAALPLVLYSSVGLFWAGAVQWMWMLHPTVGYVVATGTGIAMLFYMSTTFLAAYYISAPFSTPLSRAMYLVYQPIGAVTRWVCRCIQAINPWGRLHWRVRLLLALLLLTGGIFAYTFLTRYRNEGLIAVVIVALIVLLSKILFVLTSRPRRWIRRFFVAKIQIPVLSWLNVHFRLYTARQREDQAATNDSTLEQKSLIWLANQLPICADSDLRMDLLFTGVLDTLLESMHSSVASAEPWLSILEPLSGKFLRQILISKLPDESYRHVGILLGCIERLRRIGRITHSSNYKLSRESSGYWSQCCFSDEGLTNTRMNSSESMPFLLARDVPIPSIDSVNELKATVQLIKWRNLAGPKRADPWLEIFSQRGLYSKKYMDSCMELFMVSCTSLSKDFPYTNRAAPPGNLCLSAQEVEKRRQQAIDAIEVADHLIRQDNRYQFHRNLIWLICEDMGRPDEKWPLLPSWPNEACERVMKMHDPCLAMIAGYISGIPISITARMNGAYCRKYFIPMNFVQALLCRELSLGDTEVLWRLRAATITDAVGGVVDILREDMYRGAENLELLQRMFKHPTNCYGHSQGTHHLLFHLFTSSTEINYRGENQTIFGHHLPTFVAFNPILLVLAICEGLAPVHYSDLNLEMIGYMCYAVKQHPPSILALLTDIANWPAIFLNNQDNFTLLLNSVENANTEPNDANSIPLLRPLARSIEVLRQQVRRGLWFTRRELLDGHARRISALLYTKSASMIISSSSQSRMLSCAWTGDCVQPAIDLLAMHVEI